MRIGFDAKRAFNNTTGLGNYSRNIILSLVKHYPQHQYFLFTPGISLPDFQNEISVFSHVNIIQPIPGKPKNHWRRFGISKEIEKLKLDIYHGLSHELPANIAGISAKKVVTVHDLIPYKEDVFRNIFDDYFYKVKLKHALKHADAVVSISKATADDIHLHFGEWASKVTVVPPAVSFHTHDHYQDELENVKHRFNLPGNFLLQVGRIEYRKNVQIIIKALKQLNDPSIHYVVVGSKTRFTRSLQDFAINSGLRNQVRFIEPVTDDELACMYLLSKAVVYPSLYEGFGLPIVEAISFGKPVLTTKGGCFEEAGGTAPVYCNTTDVNEVVSGIRHLLHDNHVMKIQEGQHYINRFSGKAVADALMNIYEK